MYLNIHPGSYVSIKYVDKTTQTTTEQAIASRSDFPPLTADAWMRACRAATYRMEQTDRQTDGS